MHHRRLIGNDSCGSTAQAYGKVVDNLHRLEILTYEGVRMWVGRTDDGELERLTAAEGRQAELYRGLVALRDRYAGLVRDGYPDIPRRVSGYVAQADDTAETGVGPPAVLQLPQPGVRLRPVVRDGFGGQGGGFGRPGVQETPWRAAAANSWSAYSQTSSWNCRPARLPVRSLPPG